VKKEILVRNGISQEDAKKIVKLIKDGKYKVQASIMDDIIRVSAKKIDDLQEVIQASKGWNFRTGIAICEYEKLKIFRFADIYYFLSFAHSKITWRLYKRKPCLKLKI